MKYDIFLSHASDKYNANNVPSRLLDNLNSNYAKYYDWSDSVETIKVRVEEAFNVRVDKNDLIDNTRIQMSDDTSE